MGAAWAEAASLVVAFDSSSKDRTDYTDWKADFIHLLSLQHALAVMSLRLDADLRNIVPHLPYQDFDGPSSVSGMRAEEGDEEAEEESQSTVGRGERQQSTPPQRVTRTRTLSIAQDDAGCCCQQARK